MTERSAKWMESVKANFAKATGKPVEAWVKQAKAEGLDKDVKESRRWLKEKHGLTMVQANYVLMPLFPEPDDEEQLLANVCFLYADFTRPFQHMTGEDLAETAT